RPIRRRAILLTALSIAALTLAVVAALGIPYLSAVSQLLLAGVGLLVFLWLVWRAYTVFLYKVGRRLAFSYFLLGVLPIPLVLLLLAVVAYILSGFFLGYLYRDALDDLRSGLRTMARERAAVYALTGKPAGDRESNVAFSYYRRGRRVAGDPRAPKTWPDWMEETPPTAAAGEKQARFFRMGDAMTLAAAEERGGIGVVALWTGNLEAEISRRSELWVEIHRPDDPNLVQFELFGRHVPLRRIRKEQQAGESEKFFKQLSRGAPDPGWPDRPLLWWGETSGPLLDPASGRMVLDHLTVALNATPRTIRRHLFLGSGEVDSSVWVSLLIFAALLFDVYIIAALMAVFMIVGLSRAVNRLTSATAALRSGDFGVRIPVRRRDQVGDLQRSYNEMAAHLESSVAAAAQKEVLEREIQIARNVQTSLIPSNLPAGEGIEFATLFEPSAAIGGDYFDVLRLSETEIAVVIADVSGHGLSTGLRMAMIKAALLILIEETREPDEILRRLDSVVRNSEDRTFVTATLAIVDLARGILRLTNAGHPPTYVIRGRQVQEVLLPSSPLGGLGQSYGHATIHLEAGDLVVWLSDGLIEAIDQHGEPFGYEAVVEALAGGQAGQDAADVRDRLLAAIGRHVEGGLPSDDRTLVVMRYRSSSGLTGEIRLSDLKAVREAIAETR
ncbi:MAG: PP2C family protein-serine/threonine phosphatase, partial [Thermoanaerobaculia bacterium]